MIVVGTRMIEPEDEDGTPLLDPRSVVAVRPSPSLELRIPDEPSLSGLTIYVQAVIPELRRTTRVFVFEIR